jgi:hypothetical protein
MVVFRAPERAGWANRNPAVGSKHYIYHNTTVGDIKNRPIALAARREGRFLVRRHFSDVDELGQVARAWDLDFRQLDRGRFSGRVVQLGLEGVQVARTHPCGQIYLNANRETS